MSRRRSRSRRSNRDETRERRWRAWIYLFVALALFVVGIQVLRTATTTAAPSLRLFFERYVHGDLSALGFGWGASYVLTSGSVVAGVALAFFEGGLLDARSLLMAIVGTRLGASGIVLLIGAIDFFFHRSRSLQKSCSMGVLVFVITHTVTIPAAGLAYLGVWQPWATVKEFSLLDGLRIPLPPHVEYLGTLVVETTGGVLGAILGIALLFGSIYVFNRALDFVDLKQLRGRYVRIVSNRWIAFVIGLVGTLVTTSVTFSLGLLVPIYNRGHIRDAELVPYILGANIGTFGDTVLIALLLEPAGASQVVLTLIAAHVVVTLSVLVAFAPFERLTGFLHEWSIRDGVHFASFAVAVGVAPLGLLGFGLLLQ